MTGRRRITGWGIAVVLLCALYPALHGVYWAVPVSGAATSAALACWRLVALREAALAELGGVDHGRHG